jgi:LemA protein
LLPTIIAISLAVVFVIVLLLFIGMYNKLVRMKVECDGAWAQIDVQLKRRYDLIPNLVETVKGYASHESETLEAVIQARNQAQNVSSDAMHAAQKADAENMLTQALGRIFALAEAYPDLKANQNFSELQEELTSTENKISFARQHYNDTVARFEQTRLQFPTNLIGAAFNFEEREYFEMGEGESREAPKVSFN